MCFQKLSNTQSLGRVIFHCNEPPDRGSGTALWCGKKKTYSKLLSMYLIKCLQLCVFGDLILDWWNKDFKFPKLCSQYQEYNEKNGQTNSPVVHLLPKSSMRHPCETANMDHQMRALWVLVIKLEAESFFRMESRHERKWRNKNISLVDIVIVDWDERNEVAQLVRQYSF